jgi:hypothetical protein
LTVVCNDDAVSAVSVLIGDTTLFGSNAKRDRDGGVLLLLLLVVVVVVVVVVCGVLPPSVVVVVELVAAGLVEGAFNMLHSSSARCLSLDEVGSGLCVLVCVVVLQPHNGSDPNRPNPKNHRKSSKINHNELNA